MAPGADGGGLPTERDHGVADDGLLRQALHAPQPHGGQRAGLRAATVPAPRQPVRSRVYPKALNTRDGDQRAGGWSVGVTPPTRGRPWGPGGLRGPGKGAQP
eukprot:739335-Prorocentrum_minimum.AAC.2